MWSFIAGIFFHFMFSSFICATAWIRTLFLLWLNDIPLHEWTVFYLCIYQLIYIWVVSTFWPSSSLLLVDFVQISLSGLEKGCKNHRYFPKYPRAPHLYIGCQLHPDGWVGFNFIFSEALFLLHKFITIPDKVGDFCFNFCPLYWNVSSLGMTDRPHLFYLLSCSRN